MPETSCDRCSRVCDPVAAFCHHCGRPLPSALIGTLLGGRYRVKRFLGSGGMGRVYEALHATLLKSVAVKVLAPEFASDKDMLRRFRREALAASRLAHPNVAQTLDLGVEGDQVYIAMELAGETTLESRIATGTDMATAIDLLIQTASGLGAAHAAGVVHRDVKPANIMISRQGDHHIVKIVDFGLASLREGSPTHSMVYAAAGTPTYVSPEAARGMPVDARADVYALGVVAYELVTGSPPFVSANVSELFEMHATAPVISPRERAPHRCSPELDSLITAMLSKRPEDRPNNGDMVVQELKAMAASVIHQPPIESHRRTVLVVRHERDDADAVAQRIEQHGGLCGRVVGDDAIATFLSAEVAIGCAIAVVRDVRNTRAALDAGIVEMGAGGGVFGDAVNAALRLARLAKARETLATETLLSELGRAYRLPFSLSDKLELVDEHGPQSVVAIHGDGDGEADNTKLVAGTLQPNGALAFRCNCQAENLVPAHLMIDTGAEVRCRCSRCSQPLRVRQDLSATTPPAKPVSSPLRSVLARRTAKPDQSVDGEILAALSDLTNSQKEPL